MRLFFATVLATTSLVSAADITVTQTDFTFSPSEVSALPGDVIRFVRTGGNHTVTSGTRCSGNGTFDSPLNLLNPVFLWTVPASAAGTTVSYFCIPHCFMGMTGSITVGTPVVIGDLNSDGAVNAPDLATLLSAWGGKGPADLDHSGSVDAADLAILLGAWTG
jgi:plastocyanin